MSPMRPPVAEFHRATHPTERPLIGAEIGVYEGDHAHYMLEALNVGRFILVDCWGRDSDQALSVRDDVRDNRTNIAMYQQTLEQWEDIYQRVKNRFQPQGDKVILARASSMEVAISLPNQSLDFIYLDAGHTYEAVRQDLYAWLPKLKIGGWFMGDDYSWPGVKSAVQEFTSHHKYNLQNKSTIPEHVDNLTQWWFVKHKELLDGI